MLLTIDIGNTNISLGVFEGEELRARWKAAASEEGALGEEFSRYAGEISNAIVCSVVPEVSEAVKRFLLKQKCPVSFVGEDIEVPIENKYRIPKEVGSDRLVNAYAAVRLYSVPAVVIDFGTAITFDAVSKEGAYLGGLILPGLELSLETLSKKAALLPSIELKRPRTFIGRQTVDSMLSGVVYGYSLMCDGLVKRMRQELGEGMKTIATGGHSELISEYCSGIDILDMDLTLKGLRLIYENL